MMKYITKRLLYGLLVLVGVAMLVFFLFQGFGDPSRLVMGQSGDARTQANIRRELYLDQPKWKQFIFYLNDVSPISVHTRDEIRNKKLKGLFIGRSAGPNSYAFAIKVPYLRRSYQSKREVGTILMEALPGTLLLAFAAMLIAVAIGIPLGVVAAVKQNTWVDTTSVFASIVGISAPSFFIGIIIAYVFGFALSNWTGLHITGSWFDIDEFSGQRHLALKNLILPAITLGIRPLAIITQLTRSAMLDVLDQDYIRTAYAKGLKKTGRNHCRRAIIRATSGAATQGGKTWTCDAQIAIA